MSKFNDHSSEEFAVGDVSSGEEERPPGTSRKPSRSGSRTPSGLRIRAPRRDFSDDSDTDSHSSSRRSARAKHGRGNHAPRKLASRSRSVGRARKPKDPIFLRYDETSDPEMFQCKVATCRKRISFSKGSKSTMVKHANFHDKKGELHDREILRNWVVGCMLTLLNIPVKAFGMIFVQFLFTLMRLGPISEEKARESGDNEAERVRALLVEDIADLRKQGAVFALSADEWTWQRKRFLGVTLHSSMILPSLGEKSIDIISRFRERANAKNLEATLLKTLESLGLQLTDIAGITTDAASVMRKLGRSLQAAAAPKPFIHQLCFAHGLHLAVMDTLKCKWRRGKRSESDAEQRETVQEIETEEASAPDAVTWLLAGIAEKEGEESEADIEEEREAGEARYRGSAGRLVNKVRDVARSFHVSPVLNDELLRFAEAEGCKVKIVVDIKTRWNSTLRMCRNFLALKGPLRQFYTAASRKETFPLTEEELEVLEDIVTALGHVELAVKRLSEGAATLRLADLALQSMLEKLEECDSRFPKSLRQNLCYRILQRRGVASRLSRFTRHDQEETELDAVLMRVREEVVEQGEETLYNTFLDIGDIKAEVEKYLAQDNTRREAAQEQEQTEKEASPPRDTYERLKEKDEGKRMTQTRSPEDIIRRHRQGEDVLPNTLLGALAVIQPSSVPAERCFSKARHARRYCQERQSDERFANYLLLKEFYRKSEPWKGFAKEHPHFNDGEKAEPAATSKSKPPSPSEEN